LVGCRGRGAHGIVDGPVCGCFVFSFAAGSSATSAADRGSISCGNNRADLRVFCCAAAHSFSLGHSPAARVHRAFQRTFLAVGMVCACWCAWKGRRIFAGKLLVVWLLVTLVPLSGVLCSESLLVVSRLNPSWATPIRTELGHSMFWHLGFWEWLGAAAVYTFLCAAVFLMPADVRSENQSHFRRQR
jgi:hypothetical protein